MKRFAVLGLGRFGTTLALNLAANGADVIAIDSRRDVVDAIADQVSHAVILDATDERALNAQGISTVDCAIIAIGEHFEANVLATITCKNFGIPFVVARGGTANQCKILERIGADLVIQPEEEAARRLARQLIQPAFLSVQQLADGLSAIQIEAPAHLLDRTLGELDLRNRYGVTLVAIRRAEGTGSQKKHRLIYPRSDTKIEKQDVLIVVGADDDLAVLSGGAGSEE